MEFLVELFFENVVLLLVAEVIALAVMLAIHRKRYTPQSRRNVWLTLGVCVVLLIVQALVKTDTEKVSALVTQLVHAVDEGDINAIEKTVHPDGVRVGMGTGAENYPKNVFVMGCNIGLQIHRINEAQVGGIDIKLDGDQATVKFHVRCEVNSSTEGNVSSLSSEWTIVCVKMAGGWKMRRIVKGEVASAAFSNLPHVSLIRYVREMSEKALHNLQR